MNIEHSTEADLDEVSSWLTTAADCRIWAGPVVTFPIKMPLLAAEIMFCQDNSYCYKSATGLAGFGQLIHINDDLYHLARIITHPQYRGQGIGRKICLHLINEAWQRGGSEVSLNVYRSNVKALTLYQRLGFRQQAENSAANILFMLKGK
jgi:ribosomal-protein-alanine N-acetyltransferase